MYLYCLPFTTLTICSWRDGPFTSAAPLCQLCTTSFSDCFTWSALLPGNTLPDVHYSYQFLNYSAESSTYLAFYSRETYAHCMLLAQILFTASAPSFNSVYTLSRKNHILSSPALLYICRLCGAPLPPIDLGFCARPVFDCVSVHYSSFNSSLICISAIVDFFEE